MAGRMAKKSRHHTVTKQNSSSRKKTTHITLCCVPGIGMMMTHCSTNSTGKATFKPLEAISDPHSRVYKVPLARTVLGNLQIFFALISISSAEGVAIRNNDRTNKSVLNSRPLLQSAPISEKVSKIFLRKVEL